MVAAQKAGKEITAALEAEIEALAQAYMNAGLAAEEAADRMQEIEDRAERGKDAMSDVFGAILKGAGSAKQAIANLLMEMAKIQFMRGIFGLPAMGSVACALGGMLIPGYAAGGFTGFGGRGRSGWHRASRRVRDERGGGSAARSGEPRRHAEGRLARLRLRRACGCVSASDAQGDGTSKLEVTWRTACAPGSSMRHGTTASRSFSRALINTPGITFRRR